MSFDPVNILNDSEFKVVLIPDEKLGYVQPNDQLVNRHLQKSIKENLLKYVKKRIEDYQPTVSNPYFNEMYDIICKSICSIPSRLIKKFFKMYRITTNKFDDFHKDNQELIIKTVVPQNPQSFISKLTARERIQTIWRTKT